MSEKKYKLKYCCGVLNQNILGLDFPFIKSNTKRLCQKSNSHFIKTRNYINLLKGHFISIHLFPLHVI